MDTQTPAPHLKAGTLVEREPVAVYGAAGLTLATAINGCMAAFTSMTDPQQAAVAALIYAVVGIVTLVATRGRVAPYVDLDQLDVPHTHTDLAGLSLADVDETTLRSLVTGEDWPEDGGELPTEDNPHPNA